MVNVRVDIFNESTVLTDDQIAAVIPDLQMQVIRDFAPIWLTGAELNFVRKGQTIPGGGWQLGIFDLSDQANALGYHEYTQEGLPLGKVFAKTDQVTGSNWTITLSHELLEMLADPYTNLCFNAQTTAFNRFYSTEVCDAVEADSNGYKINNTWVSNFVYPDWFNPAWAANSRQFDFMKQTTNPLQLTKGGYISYVDLAYASNGWMQTFGDISVQSDAFANAGKRSEDRLNKRNIPRHEWRKSDPVRN